MSADIIVLPVIRIERCEGNGAREAHDPRRDCPWKCAIGDPKCLCAKVAVVGGEG